MNLYSIKNAMSSRYLIHQLIGGWQIGGMLIKNDKQTNELIPSS
jgi:hypothetical protein